MSVIRVGATKKFADNWENIFGGKKSKSALSKSTGKASKKSTKKKAAAPKTAKKSAVKKAGKKTK